jgi:hypothetical protein
MRGRKLSTALLGVLVGVILAGNQLVFATHAPADKVVASGDNLTTFAAGQDIPILTATLKTSKPTDLMLHVTLECSLITTLITGDGTGPTDNAEASTNIDVWIEIDGQVVPVMSMSQPPQNPPQAGNKEADGVTFCNRVYGRSVTDQENDGQDLESDYIRTKSAHGFNWLRLNMGAGPHTIVVKADIDTSTVGTATAQAIIGTRTLIAEPAKLANDATITNL